MSGEFSHILKEARRKFNEGMNWIDFSNMFFSQGSPYVPKDPEERERYLESEEFQEIVNMKHDLEKKQEDVEEPEYSGRVNLRLPRSLHRDLAVIAEREQTSLNSMMVVFLAQSVVKYKSQL